MTVCHHILTGDNFLYAYTHGMVQEMMERLNG